MKISIETSTIKATIDVDNDANINEYMDAVVSALIMESFTKDTIIDGLNYAKHILSNQTSE